MQPWGRVYFLYTLSMMEQTDTRERHGNAIFIASFNHMVIAYRTTRLDNVIYSTLMGTLNIVSKREECIRTQRNTFQCIQPSPFFFTGQHFRFLRKELLPNTVSQHPKVLNLPWVEKIRRADRDNTIDIYISDDHDDVLADGIWEQFFTEKPEVLTREEKREWLNTLKGVALGSDAFFPFGDNIERAHKTGVEYIAQAGGSVRDDHVIETCDKYGIAMAFTGIRLFHH